ncbi:MAG TPA: alkaline phosphatase PhoX [Planctomycetaceae bacterium]|nr:alkaline phosphatase PhoX [Planctomycetaceae bacterium]
MTTTDRAHSDSTNPPATNRSRRDFLQRSAAAVGSAALAGAFGAFLSRASFAAARGPSPEYGALLPLKDETTGLELLQLPEGFRYRSFGWRGDAMSDGTPTPAAHDGMAVIAAHGGCLTLCRNHEVSRVGRPFGPEAMTFDSKAMGGCAHLEFDAARGEWLSSRPSLAGTLKNCAGGPTPWGSWLSCEETVLTPGDVNGETVFDLEHEHGWIFEVPAGKPATAAPLKDMGRFVHEAVAVDPETGSVYETEDRGTSGFYRFVPNVAGDLARGGRLFMLKVEGRPDLRKSLHVGDAFDVTWVPIDDPYRAHSPGTTDQLGVYHQGKSAGASTFARLEGCWYGNKRIYVVSTSGGNASEGQVWQYDPRTEQLKLLFESPDAQVLDSPDNIAVSPRGGIVLCEDGKQEPQRLHGLTPDGRLFPFAANNVVLNGERNQIAGDFRGSEWAGATFSPDGEWLFVNIQRPGITFAITGPWRDGGL